MDAIGAFAILILIIMIFFLWPVFWLIVFGFVIHPGWFIVAFIWWALSD